MKKILAVLLAASMLFAFAACGGNDDAETTTAPVTDEVVTDAPIDETEAATDAPVADESEVATEAPVDASEAASTADPSAVDASAAETTAAVADKEMTKAEFVAFLNAETAKAAKGSYKYNRDCNYTSPIDVGGATDTLNSLISSLSDGKEDINSVVGGFLGIGNKSGNFPKDTPKSNYQLKATKLTEADLQNFSYDAATGVYSFTLANAKNPQKDNSTPISRFTNDFITHQEVVDGVDEAAGGAIKVTDTTVNYKNIKVSVAVAGGKITKINYSYAFDAILNLKLAVIKVEGTGAAVTKGEFSNLAY